MTTREQREHIGQIIEDLQGAKKTYGCLLAKKRRLFESMRTIMKAVDNGEGNFLDDMSFDFVVGGDAYNWPDRKEVMALSQELKETGKNIRRLEEESRFVSIPPLISEG